MKAQLYFYGALAIPWLAIAHGDADGHVEAIPTGNPEQRMKVLAVVITVVVLLLGFMWYSHRKNTNPKTDDTGAVDTPK